MIVFSFTLLREKFDGLLPDAHQLPVKGLATAGVARLP